MPRGCECKASMDADMYLFDDREMKKSALYYGTDSCNNVTSGPGKPFFAGSGQRGHPPSL